MRSISINVAGSKLQIRSDAEADYVQGLADEITARFEAIKPRGRRQDQSFRTMAMIAISLLDDLTNAERRRQQVQDQAREFATRMIEKIDELLSERES